MRDLPQWDGVSRLDDLPSQPEWLIDWSGVVNRVRPRRLLDGDTQRFNLDDLEAWLASTGDAAAVVEYLAAKYMDTDSARHQRVVANAEALLAQLAVVLPQLKGVQ